MSAVDGLKQRFLARSQPDGDGVLRDGAGKRRARTAMAMDALRGLWAEACDAVDFPVPSEGVGLAAVGSLARGQVGPCSDLDLVVMVDDRALSDAQLGELANKLWYPLWDSGLDLDHAVRTRAQCEAVTDHDLPAAMGWLDVAPIAGDTALVRATADSILVRWRKAARKRLPELLDSARARLEEFGRLPYLNQPDIKEARGGLRDTVLVSALAASWLADRPHGAYDDAVERLLDVRDAIHLVANKDTNLLLTPYQARVAAMMGLADPTLPEGEREAASIDDLMTLLARLGRRIAFALDSTASRATHSLTHERPRFSWFQMLSPRGGGRRAAPVFDTVAPGVARHEGELVLAAGADPADDAPLALRVGVAAAETGLPVNPGTLVSLTQCPIHDNQWTEESRALFLRLLGSGPRLVDAWEELDSVDLPGRWIPEWLGIRNRPSASAAHRYTIDRHSVEVAARLGGDPGAGADGPAPVRGLGTTSGALVVPDAGAEPGTAPGGAAGGERAGGMSMAYDEPHRAALLLAGLLHDIGKRPGVTDHAAEGARHTSAILTRMGFDPSIVGMATLLVREHLALSEFATGRDPDDPATGEDLAARVDHDRTLLAMLFDLTRADGSSLGATANETITKRYGWSRWRETLVRHMVAAAADRCH